MPGGRVPVALRLDARRKGATDRVTILPATLRGPLLDHLVARD